MTLRTQHKTSAPQITETSGESRHDLLIVHTITEMSPGAHCKVTVNPSIKVLTAYPIQGSRGPIPADFWQEAVHS